MAAYNRKANIELYSLLMNRSDDLIFAETGSFFSSIPGLLNHILLSDLNWLTAFRDSEDLDLPELNSQALVYQRPGRKENLYDNFQDLTRHRETLDELLLDLTENTTEEIFQKHVTLFKTTPQVMPFGKCLMHVFNHQTHHRGAISQILDEHGIENDYSSLVKVFMSEI